MAGGASLYEANGLVCADGKYSRTGVPRGPPRNRVKLVAVFAIVLAVCIAPALLVLHTGSAPLRSSASAYVPHNPIIIDSNADFHATAALEGWPGSGTLASPYIISGYEFGRPSTAFYVGNSTVHFVLRDCYFHDSASAIYLLMSSNARIENSTVENCNIGMVMYLASATVANNSITGCTYAVFDYFSMGDSYLANEVSGSVLGICLMMSDGNVLSGNTFRDNLLSGTLLSYSQLNMLRDNVFLKDGIMISGSEVEYWDTQDIDASNTVNGAPVLYLADDAGSTVSAHYGQVILANCVDTIIDSQDLDNTSAGVLAGFCSGVTVENSVLRDNYAGMLIDYCSNMTLMDTYCVNNILGIEMDDSEYCNVSGNTFQSDVIGIVAWYTGNCSLSSNTIVSEEVAIELSSSPDALLRNNLMAASGIFIEGELLEDWNTHDIDTSNTVNTYPVVYLKNLVGAPVPVNAGQVILANCAQMMVTGSYIDRATAAFQLGFTSGCRVTTLSASNCAYGVRLYQSPGIQVDNAMLNDDRDGVYVEASDLCTITTNFITNCTNSAILLLDSTRQTLQFNTMTNCGIKIGSGMLECWNTHTIDISNFVNTKSVYYRKDSTGLSVPSGYGQIILANCTASTIGPQTIVNASAALQLGFCNGITVNNLTASENSVAVLLEQSISCSLKGPWITDNFYGVFMSGSSHNFVIDGLFYMNDYYAIYLDQMSSYNLVTGNTFQYNNGAGDVYDQRHIQANDDGDFNSWNGTTGGNYWQDWQTPDANHDGIVDKPYHIVGFAHAQDNLPLTTPTHVIPEFGSATIAGAVLALVAIMCLGQRRRILRKTT